MTENASVRHFFYDKSTKPIAETDFWHVGGNRIQFTIILKEEQKHIKDVPEIAWSELGILLSKLKTAYNLPAINFSMKSSDQFFLHGITEVPTIKRVAMQEKSSPTKCVFCYPGRSGYGDIFSKSTSKRWSAILNPDSKTNHKDPIIIFYDPPSYDRSLKNLYHGPVWQDLFTFIEDISLLKNIPEYEIIFHDGEPPYLNGHGISSHPHLFIRVPNN